MKKVTTGPYKGDETCPLSYGTNLNHIYLIPELMFFPLCYWVYYYHHDYTIIIITKVSLTKCRQFEKIGRKKPHP